MRAEADVVAVIGLGLLVQLIGAENRRLGRVGHVPGAQRRVRPADVRAPLSAPLWGRSSSVDTAMLLPLMANGTFRKVCVGSAWGGSYSWRPSVRGREISDTSMIEIPENQQPAYISFPQRMA